jgi:hypothetical protein
MSDNSVVKTSKSNHGLLPCPFCGTEAELNTASNDVNWLIISCPSIMCPTMPSLEGAWAEVDERIAAWNQRPRNETGGSHSERYRVALQKIIDDGDYTAPEGMKLIAREALANGTGESRAALDVLAERRRQVTVEGWTSQHDDQHNDSELAEAAVAYASHAASRGWSFADSPDEYRNDRPFPPERAVFGYGDVTWPKHWSWDWWKPTSPRRDLVKAAALILAEIERLDRHSQKASEQPSPVDDAEFGTTEWRAANPESEGGPRG